MNVAGGLLVAAVMAPASCYAMTGAPAPSQLPAAVVGAFRTDAEAVYRSLEPVCGTTLNPVLRKHYEPARARLAALLRRSAGTPFQAILADAKKRQEILASEVDCMRAREDAGTAARIDRDLAATAHTLSRMERAVSFYMSGKH